MTTNANAIRKLDRRKGGSWGKPHKDRRTAANRGTRAVLKHLDKGGRDELLNREKEDTR